LLRRDAFRAALQPPGSAEQDEEIIKIVRSRAGATAAAHRRLALTCAKSTARRLVGGDS
jgi:hypothetical protein